MARRYSTRVLTAAGAGLLTLGLAGSAIAASAASAASPPHGTISTVIGGPGGPAPATSVSVNPCTLKFVSGELYFSNNGTVVDRVSQRTGLLTPIAGSGKSSGGIPVQDGIAASAYPLGGCGVAVDGAGTLLIISGDQVLAVPAKTGTFYGKRMTAGRVYTVASGFSAGSGFEQADAGASVDVQQDASGNLLVDVAGSQASHTNPEGDSQVFVIAERAGTFYGKKMARGKAYLIAGSLDGYMLGNAVPATQADLGENIGTLRLDSAGNVVIADTGGLFNGGPDSTGPPVPPQVRVVASRAGTFYGQHMKAGYIYTIAGGGTETASGVPAVKASLPGADAVALDHAGNVIVAGGGVRVIAAKSGTFYGLKMTVGDIYTLPGFPNATAVAVDGAGNVLVATESDWRVQMLAERTGSYYGKSVRAGHLYDIAGNGRPSYSGDGGPATAAEITPGAVATDRSGDMTAVADPIAAVVRVVPARTGVFFGRSMRAGFIYTVVGTGTVGGATMGYPWAIAFDRDDNLVIADRFDHLLRVVSRTTGIFYGRHMIAGHSYVIAGGGADQFTSGVPALTAEFEGPTAVATDAAGNVLIVDNNGFQSTTWVRVVAAKSGTFYGQAMTAGDIYTVAGDGKFGQSGDGGPATAASILSQGVAVDGSGNIVLADVDRIRVVAAKSGTFYGQKMTVGFIYLVAGGGTQNPGNGTPALKADFGPDNNAVAVDSAGNLLLGGGSVVYMVAERAGSYYGRAMHAGDVYIVARSAPPWFALGDGGPAVGAVFSIEGIAVAPRTGDLLIADTNRVRSVSR